MSFVQLGALGELIGAIAAIVLLGYIAVQIRQNSKLLDLNTRATEAASRQAFSAQDQTYLSSALDPSVLAVAVSKLENGVDRSPLEKSQLLGRQHLNFRVFETAYSQFQKGVLDQNEWERYRQIVGFLMRSDEPSRQMWSEFRDLFDPGFTAEVERIAAIPAAEQIRRPLMHRRQQ